MYGNLLRWAPSGKTEARTDSTLFGEVRAQASRGPAVELTTDKKRQHAKSAEDSSKTKPLALPRWAVPEQNQVNESAAVHNSCTRWFSAMSAQPILIDLWVWDYWGLYLYLSGFYNIFIMNIYCFCY